MVKELHEVHQNKTKSINQSIFLQMWDFVVLSIYMAWGVLWRWVSA